jgi:F420-non-reducing hydrogenase small subunit
VTREPRIVAFLCDRCAYQAADRAGQARLELPHGVLAVRVPCTGRVEPAFVLQAFREGADGVLVAGCHPGDCHHVDGNLRAAARLALLSRALEQAAIEPARLRLAWTGGGEAARFAAIVREMSEALRALGPLAYRARALEVGDRAEAALLGRGPLGGDGGEEGVPLPPPLEAPGRRAPLPARPRVALYWNASCGGCEEAVLDLGEGLLDLLAKVDVVLWPIALDAKRRDVEALADGSVDVALVSGAVRLADEAEWAKLLRRKARVLVAFGACAHMGGVAGLGNLCEPEEILEASYRRQPSISNPDAPLPGGRATACGHVLSLPPLLSRALPLGEVVPVDCAIPGCPPSPPLVAAALDRLLSGDLPSRGAVLAPNVPLCDACPRQGSRPERIELTALQRLGTTALDPEACFLAQGVVCLGPGTRQGCQPGCVEAGMPCRGCFGPLDGVRDGGAAMLSAFASLLAGGEAEVAALARELADPAGTFWRYSFAAGLAPRRRRPG